MRLITVSGPIASSVSTTRTAAPPAVRQRICAFIAWMFIDCQLDERSWRSGRDSGEMYFVFGYRCCDLRLCELHPVDSG
jgi:hypothetical protein